MEVEGKIIEKLGKKLSGKRKVMLGRIRNVHCCLNSACEEARNKYLLSHE